MRIRKKVIGMLLAGTLCFGVLTPVHATTIDEAKQKANELEQQKEAAEGQQASLATQLNGIVAQMQQTQEQITTKVAEIEQTEQDLIQAKIDENSRYESMKLRIRYMYENGNSEFLTLLLESKSITELLNKAEYVTQISDYDRQELVKLQEVVKQVEEKEAQLKVEYDELQTLQASLSSQQVQVQTLLAEKNVQIANLEQEIGENAKLLEELIAQAAEAERVRKEAEAARAAEAAREAERAAQANKKPSTGNSNKPSSGGGSYVPGGGGANTVVGNGQFAHPCPGSYLSSGYGYRSFDNSFHRGYDFANHGVSLPTYAAAAGKVVIAGYSASAGNWVVIDHGNGLVTKYMHHSALYVSAGQTVSKGQNLGMTGNTGYSAGVHLHFQVEKNGSAVDPGLYL